MKFFTFLNKNYDVLEIVKAASYEDSLQRAKFASSDTPYFSESHEEFYN